MIRGDILETTSSGNWDQFAVNEKLFGWFLLMQASRPTLKNPCTRQCWIRAVPILKKEKPRLFV